MSAPGQEERLRLLTAYATGAMTAMDLRRRLGNATFGEVLRMLADEGLELPQAPVAGREETLARAREWMFPKTDHG